MKTTWMALTLTAVAIDAHAIGRLANVEIIDRDTGSTLQAHYFRGEYWVAGTPGHRYSILIQNQRSDRELAVASVDGINVISGESAGVAQTGYVFDARQGYDIDGWRKSDQEVSAFTFTSVPDSYAARTRRPQNVGVIGIALFLERPMPTSPSVDDALRSGAAPPAATSDLETSVARSAISAATAERAQALGTGHGEREFSAVTETPFERQSPRPNEVVRIRYDSLPNLVALGVIARPAPLPPAPNPFPRSSGDGYVPDPPS